MLVIDIQMERGVRPKEWSFAWREKIIREEGPFALDSRMKERKGMSSFGK